MENKQLNYFYRLIMITITGVFIGSICLFINFFWGQGFSVNKVIFYMAAGFLGGTTTSAIFEVKSTFPKFLEEEIRKEGRRLRLQYFLGLKRSLRELTLFFASRKDEKVNTFLKGFFGKGKYSHLYSADVMTEDLKIDISEINRLRNILSIEEETKDLSVLRPFLDDSFSGLEDDPTNIISLSIFSEIISEKKARWRDLLELIKKEAPAEEAEK